jgi:hypothetical protein
MELAAELEAAGGRSHTAALGPILLKNSAVERAEVH